MLQQKCICKICSPELYDENGKKIIQEYVHYQSGPCQETLDEIWVGDFENTRRVHDWRNHAFGLRDIWHSLSMEAKIAVYLVAEEAASNEEWD